MGAPLDEIEQSAVADDITGALSRNYSIFTHYNKQRLHIMKQLAPPDRYALLSAIPLLYHINNHRAPGYVPEMGQNPGVYGFKLNDDIRNLRKNFISKTFLTSVGTVERPLVLSLASIGSAGTLAQTEKSDFDLWVIARDDITRTEWRNLEKKGKAIKSWLISQDDHIDVNFYLGTPERIRAHNFGAVSDDSAGSALGKLLKEEFYRTCVVWAGKIPFWWMVDENVNTPEGYGEWIKAFEGVRLPFKDDLMDLGPLERGTLAQFLAAVLWQTNKSLASPFKSLLKLAVVNAYAENMSAPLLAETVRQNVRVNPTHGDATDPYLCLFAYAADSLRFKQDHQGERLLAEMFFLKTLGASDGLRITMQGVDQTVNRKRNEVRNYIRAYGVGKEDMRDLENINNWPFVRGLEYRAIVQAFVKRVYDRVMLLLKRLGITLVKGKVVTLREDYDEDAVTLLGEFSTISEKVDCFYGMATPKVQPVPVSFRKILHQKAYALLYDPEAPSAKRWSIQEEVPLGVSNTLKYLPEPGEAPPPKKGTGVVNVDEDPLEQELYEEAMQQQLLVSGRSAMSLLMWLALNKITNMRTMYRVKIGSRLRPVRELRRLIFLVREKFAHPLYDDAMPESEFVKPPTPVRAFCSFDFNQHSHFREEEKDKLKSSSTRFSINSITVGIQNSYGIMRVNHVDAAKYPPAAMLAKLLREFMETPERELADCIILHSADSPEHEALTKSFRETLIKLHSSFRKMPPRKGLSIRYVTRLGEDYVLLTRNQNGYISARQPGTMLNLLRLLETPESCMVQTLVDADIQGAERLREMVRLWMPGQVQIFVRRGRPTSSVHVIDEAGCFMNDRLDEQNLDLQLKGMVIFLASLGQTPLTYAANRDGKMKFAVQEIVNVSEIESQFQYRLAKYAGSGLPTDGIRPLYVSVQGSLVFTDPHKLTLVSPNATEEHDLSGDRVLADMAAHIARVLKEADCSDFTIVSTKQTEGAPRCAQAVEYLALRRSLDRTLRRLISAETGSSISGPRKVVGYTGTVREAMSMAQETHPQ